MAYASASHSADEDQEVLLLQTQSAGANKGRRRGAVVGIALLVGSACLLKFGSNQSTDLRGATRETVGLSGGPRAGSNGEDLFKEMGGPRAGRVEEDLFKEMGGPRGGDQSTDLRGAIPETMGLSGGPDRKLTSLYCVSAMRAGSYEEDILKEQLILDGQMGVFGCDDFDIFSSKVVKLGEFVRGTPVYSVKFAQALVDVSMDGTAGNAELFAKMWEAVKQRGHFLKQDWTVKVDPDTVMFADRLRTRLADRNPDVPSYVANCLSNGGSYYYNSKVGSFHDKGNVSEPNVSVAQRRRLRAANATPSNATGHGNAILRLPSLYGALEVISRRAMEKYFDMGNKTCDLQAHLGEDRFMGVCLSEIGVHRINDFTMVSDSYCKACQCSDYSVAYHPYKSTKDWMTCWMEAAGAKSTGAVGPSKTEVKRVANYINATAGGPIVS